VRILCWQLYPVTLYLEKIVYNFYWNWKNATYFEKQTVSAQKINNTYKELVRPLVVFYRLRQNFNIQFTCSCISDITLSVAILFLVSSGLNQRTCLQPTTVRSCESDFQFIPKPKISW